MEGVGQMNGMLFMAVAVVSCISGTALGIGMTAVLFKYDSAPQEATVTHMEDDE